MSVVSTYGEMQQQIAYELGFRNDLLTVPAGFNGITTSPVQKAIQTAIAKWERKHFYFNELRAVNNFTTVRGQEFYTASDWPILGTNPHIDNIWVLISSNRYALNPRTESYMVDTSMNPNTQGQPSDYSYYSETLRFYPIPDGAYPLTMEGVQRLPQLVNATDMNVWTQDAEALIRAEAKYDLLINTIKNTDLAAVQKALIYGTADEEGYLASLQGETVSRIPTPRMRANYF